MRQYHNHLLAGLPNWWLVRWVIAWVNRRMRASDSAYYLLVRYRGPKRRGAPRPWGDLKRRDARRLSVYLRERPGVRDARARECAAQTVTERALPTGEVEREIDGVVYRFRPLEDGS